MSTYSTEPQPPKVPVGPGSPPPGSGGFQTPTAKRPVGIVIPDGLFNTNPQKAKSLTSEKATLLTMLGQKQFSWAKPYAQALWDEAHRYGLTAPQLLILMQYEGGWKQPNQPNSAGALGPAQIHMPSWNGKQPGKNAAGQQFEGGKVTAERASDFVYSIKFAAWYMGGFVQKYGGNFRKAYEDGYNPGLPNGSPEGDALMQLYNKYLKGSAAQVNTTQTPEQQVANAERKSSLKQAQEDPWVVIGKKGELRFVKTVEPPPAAIKMWGLPVTASQFRQAWSHYNDLFHSYAARSASPAEVAMALKKGWSDYALSVYLSKQPDFLKSPTWKSRAPDYQAAWKGIMGGKPVDRELVRKAIVNNWTGEAFTSALRQRKDYTGSLEFRSNAASLSNVYTQVWGTAPTGDAQRLIQEATAAGYDSETFAAYLRTQPTYGDSAEYRARTTDALQQLGATFGGTVIAGEQPSGYRAGTTQPPPLPNDKRIPGKPKTPAPSPGAYSPKAA